MTPVLYFIKSWISPSCCSSALPWRLYSKSISSPFTLYTPLHG